MPILGADHDPSNYDGFTEFQLRIYERFANVAVEWHLDDNLSEINSHELGVVTVETLLSQYDLPVAFTIPTGTSTEARTTGADQTTLAFSVSIWVSDYDQPYGLMEAQTLIGRVVDNVEANRTLLDQSDVEPLAEDTTMTQTNYDFELSPMPDQGHLKYGTAQFEVRTKRLIPR